MKLTADLETTTDENDCRAWAWATCEIGNINNFNYGNDLDGFFEFVQTQENSTYYFHNARFDGEFLMVYLFEHGFKHVTDSKEEATKTFTTLISDKGQFYAMKIIFEKSGKKTKYIKIIDSLKILPFSVEEVAKGFNLPIGKGKIDYDKYRPIGYQITPDELDYIRKDVEIVARALEVLFAQNLTKMTQGSNALFDYKQTVTEKNFKRWFPTPDYDKDIRQSYKGGFTYLNPKYKSKDIGTGLVFDVNSLYPWVLHDCLLPYGDPIYFEGKYENDDLYPLYIQMVTCQFELKENHIPTIQLKNNLSFIPTEYLTSSTIEIDGKKVYQEVTLCLTSVDLELFFEHYEVLNPVFHNGWKFKATKGLFTEYVDKWMKVKIESTLNGNKAMRTLSKLMLNALYGKFSTAPFVASKIPYYDNGVIKYDTPKEEYIDDNGRKRKRTKYETRKPVYLPVGTFVTAWARYKTITSAQKIYDLFIYADTDSLHIHINLPKELLNMPQKELEMLTTKDLLKYGVKLPDGFDVDPVSLGAWKLESRFTRARFIRQKCYIEDWNPAETWGTDQYNKDLLNITCAGMPERCYVYVDWENFFEGAKYKGKLQPKHVKGGIVLKEIDFTIQKSF